MRRLPTLFAIGLCAVAACTGQITNPNGDDSGSGSGTGSPQYDPNDPTSPPPVGGGSGSGSGTDTGSGSGSSTGSGSGIGSGSGTVGPGTPVYASAHPRIYLAVNKPRLQAMLQQGTPAATRFQQIVDGQMNGADWYNFSSYFAALMGQLTGNPSYCTYAVNMADQFVSSEEAAINGGNAPAVAADSYLEVGPDIGDLMLTYDWCYDTLSSSQRTRWTNYAAQAVANVWNPSGASWGGVSHPWSGWATHDPSDNYYYSFLRATMMFGLAAHDEHPQAAQWLDYFRTTKIENELLPTFNADLQGGGSREGTGYGVAMQNLWGIYDFWQASTGEDLARQTLHTRASLLNELQAIVPTLDFVAPTGDHARDSSAALFDYERNYILQLAFMFRDDPIAPRAKWIIDHSSVTRMSQGFMAIQDFLYDIPTMPETDPSDMDPAYYASGIGEVYARSSWASDATWVNLIAGPYTQSHAHHDQGHLMIFKGDAWLATDANQDSHSGINQGEENHNLVRITSGGQTVTQVDGTTSTLTALHTGTGWIHFAADLTPAYGGKPEVSNDERETVFVEPGAIVVFDRVTTAGGTQQTWQLNSAAAPQISGANATFAVGGHTLAVSRVAPAAANMSNFNWASNSEYTGGYRLDETVGGGAQQFLHVLSVDGAVTGVARSDDGDGRIGVTVTLADGRTATVRFSPTAVDGTLQITGGNFASVNVALTRGVDSLPQ